MAKFSTEVQAYANMIAGVFPDHVANGMDVSRFKFEEDITEHRGYCYEAGTLNRNGDRITIKVIDGIGIEIERVRYSHAVHHFTACYDYILPMTEAGVAEAVRRVTDWLR